MLDIFLFPYPFFCIRIFAFSRDQIFAAFTKKIVDYLYSWRENFLPQNYPRKIAFWVRVKVIVRVRVGGQFSRGQFSVYHFYHKRDIESQSIG